MIDWNSPLISIRFEYSTRYNMRPGEMYGMGKESLTIFGTGSYKELLKSIMNSSNIKFKDDVKYICGTDESFINPDWTAWIGQPMFLVYDIKVTELTEEEAIAARNEHAAFLTKYGYTNPESWAKVK